MNSIRSSVPRSLFTALLMMAFAASGGCTKTGVKNKLGRVTGKVTLGGQPLADAMVMFSGIEGGSPSAGRTDSSGMYTLVFSRGIDGAEVGSHMVTISTFQPGSEDATPPSPDMPEKVPFKYRDAATALKADVKAGSNTIDFPLEPGPVEDPKEAAEKAKSKGKGKKVKPAGVCY